MGFSQVKHVGNLLLLLLLKKKTLTGLFLELSLLRHIKQLKQDRKVGLCHKESVLFSKFENIFHIILDLQFMIRSVGIDGEIA